MSNPSSPEPVKPVQAATSNSTTAAESLDDSIDDADFEECGNPKDEGVPGDEPVTAASPDNPLDKLPEKQREDIISAEIVRDPKVLLNPKVQRAVMMTMKTHKGPLPASEDFASYELITPGAGNRIIEMAERSLAHNQSMQVREQDRDDREQQRATSYQTNEFAEARRGQNYGLTICLSGIGLGTLCILLGHEVAGTVFGGVPLVTMVYTFIQGRKRPAAPGNGNGNGNSNGE